MKLYPDPECANAIVERFEKENKKLSKKDKENLYLLSSYSRFLGNACIRDPKILDYIGDEKVLDFQKKNESYKAQVGEIFENYKEESSFMKKLRNYKYRELARIVFRDISGRSKAFREILEELSDLASSIIDGVVKIYATSTLTGDEGSFCVLAMGKLGGRLLNLSSDVDLVYIFENKDNDESPFCKLAEKITKALSAITEDGFLYRVDLRLRPGGNKSPIAVSLEGALEHYFYWGDTWERAALINVRPVAGDLEIGEKFVREITPFVYVRSLDYQSIQDLKDMKRKLDGLKKERDVKLGKGGIREIEFFVNALQLVNGGSFPELRWKNTLDALQLLSKLNFIDKDSSDILTNSYIFLRKVEHYIQLTDELQTHRLPSEEKPLLVLSRKMGFPDIDTFMDKYNQVTNSVYKIYERLFYDPSKKVEEEGKEFWELADFLTEGNIPQEDAIRSLKSLGFKYPETALDIISSLVDTKRGFLTQKGRMMTRKVIPAFLSKVVRSHDPDAALRNLERFVFSVGGSSSVYAMLYENPDIIALLTKLFSTSGMLSSFFTRHPEYLDVLTLKDVRVEFYDKKQMLEELNNALSLEDSYESKLDALRRFKHIETLKICLRELNGEVDPIYVGRYLSMMAEAILEMGLRLAVDIISKRERRKKRELARILVLGMGKLGGRELSYNSDLDIIIIYEGDDHEIFSRIGQRLISILSTPTGEGFCYKIDLDLRPSGRAGALVTSLDSFNDYHKTSARLWERQALIKARQVAGNSRLGNEVMKTINHFVYERPLPEGFHKEIHKLRMRMERELARESGKRKNLKTGRGGLVDIEFLVQMLQLKYGSKYRSLRKQNTIEALEALFKNSLIDKDTFNKLYGGYLFLKKMEDFLRLLHDRSISELQDRDFEYLSREIDGYSDPSELKNKYLIVTDEIRSIYDSYFNS